jgi:hydrogenase maturation protease
MFTKHTDQTAQAQQTPTIVVIGIGNEYRQDDAAGLLVARALRRLVPRSVQVLECTGASLELIDDWALADRVVLVDAVLSGAAPGTIYYIEVHDQPIPAYLFHYSTHDFNVSDSIELARLLGKLPRRLIVYGIEGMEYGQGTSVSQEVAEAVETVTSRILQYVHLSDEDAESQEQEQKQEQKV